MRGYYYLLTLCLTFNILSSVQSQHNGRKRIYVYWRSSKLAGQQLLKYLNIILVIIITGGYSDEPNTSRAAEIWSPDGVSCKLPDLELEARYLHTQDGNLVIPQPFYFFLS